MKPTDTLYGTEDQEKLDNTVEEVVEGVIDDACNKPGESFDSIADRITWPIQVHEFRRMSVAGKVDRIVDRVIEDTLEFLDEEHGDPDGDRSEASNDMVAAARDFAEVVARDYVSWGCERTGKIVEVSREQARQSV